MSSNTGFFDASSRRNALLTHPRWQLKFWINLNTFRHLRSYEITRTGTGASVDNIYQQDDLMSIIHGLRIDFEKHFLFSRPSRKIWQRCVTPPIRLAFLFSGRPNRDSIYLNRAWYWAFWSRDGYPTLCSHFEYATTFFRTWWSILFQIRVLLTASFYYFEYNCSANLPSMMTVVFRFFRHSEFTSIKITDLRKDHTFILPVFPPP